MIPLDRTAFAQIYLFISGSGYFVFRQRLVLYVDLTSSIV